MPPLSPRSGSDDSNLEVSWPEKPTPECPPALPSGHSRVLLGPGVVRGPTTPAAVSVHWNSFDMERSILIGYLDG